MVFKFEFTEQECNLLLKGLGELPAKESYQMIGKIQQESKEQIQQLAKKQKKDNEIELKKEGE